MPKAKKYRKKAINIYNKTAGNTCNIIKITRKQTQLSGI